MAQALATLCKAGTSFKFKQIGDRTQRAMNQHWSLVLRRYLEMATVYNAAAVKQSETPAVEVVKYEPVETSNVASTPGKKRPNTTPSHHNRAGKKVKRERHIVFSDDEESDHENGDRDKHPDADFEV
ncbi:hypothetical protein LIA77_07272 [Sarocladium implicatum]|nr:hypothetical protein LIA77_07272 [Sarocladium implicatum]